MTRMSREAGIVDVADGGMATERVDNRGCAREVIANT
jgi:hypothetical protein